MSPFSKGETGLGSWVLCTLGLWNASGSLNPHCHSVATARVVCWFYTTHTHHPGWWTSPSAW